MCRFDEDDECTDFCNFCESCVCHCDEVNDAHEVDMFDLEDM